jgi:hypothetical protein
MPDAKGWHLGVTFPNVVWLWRTTANVRFVPERWSCGNGWQSEHIQQGHACDLSRREFESQIGIHIDRVHIRIPASDCA